MSAVVAISGERSPLGAVFELAYVCRRHVFEADPKLSAEFGEIPEDVSELERERLTIVASDDAISVSEDLS